MSLWLTVRRRYMCLVTLCIMAGILLLTQGWTVMLPSLFSGSPVIVRFALLVPLLVAMVVAFGLTSGDPLLEAVASRRLALLDAGYTLFIGALTLGICVVIAAFSPHSSMVEAGRNTLGYLGLTLTGVRLLSRYTGALLPVSVAFGLVIFGGDNQPQPSWSTWLLVPATQPWSWLVAGGFLISGLAVFLLPRRIFSAV